MIDFVQNLFSNSLKGNIHLYRAFMTGVVRTATDGILSGLNNLKICTMLDKDYSNKFGFTEKEVEKLLEITGYERKKEEVKTWYNGYNVGIKYANDPSTVSFFSKIYNPWSLLQYISSAGSPDTYWVNTGSTELLEKLISEADKETQEELSFLMEGKALERKQINQNVILLDLDNKNHEPWSFLFFAGYLTTNAHTFKENKNYYTLKIPNQEIAELYNKLVINAIGKTFTSKKLTQLLNSLIEGSIAPVNTLLGDFVSGMCSYHDLPHKDLERSLHLFVLGLLASLSERYLIKSNLESGQGRYDILMIPKKSHDPAILIGFKKGTDSNLEPLADEALKQIKRSTYHAQLKDIDYKGTIFSYGIATFKKQLVAKMEPISI